jgi:hypothetical protein
MHVLHSVLGDYAANHLEDRIPVRVTGPAAEPESGPAQPALAFGIGKL